MNIKEQVCSMELAKQLKELGVKQDSFFVWFKPKECPAWNPYPSELWQIDDPERFDIISAFTSAELGKLIPFRVVVDGKECFCNQLVGYTDHEYSATVCYNHIDEDLNLTLVMFDSSSRTEADARARMLIYLIENKLYVH